MPTELLTSGNPLRHVSPGGAFLRHATASRRYRLYHAGLALLLWLLATPISLAAEVTFPLRPAPQSRYLEDSRGKPFLLTGDSAWALIADLSYEDTKLYLDTRKRQGFNTILVSLIEHKFARKAPANFYGDLPFLGAAFERPNEAYFDRVEAVIEAAASRGMLVLLCPAYLGAGGGPEGWYNEMVAAGPEKLKAYGRYVGRRFARFKNIIWMQGGDYDPPDKALVNAVAEGIAERMPDALQSVHANRDTVTGLFWEKSKWLDIDTVYTYDNVADAVFARYRLGLRRPFFLVEGLYEGEHGVGEREVRLIAYSALLSGAGGQIFGNNPMWHFGAPGLFAAPGSWQEALHSRGAQSIEALARLFNSLEWWKLTPDQGVLLKTVFQGESRGFAARDMDGAFAVFYVRDVDQISIDLDSLAGGPKRLRWYDPMDGSLREEVKLSEDHGVQDAAMPEQANKAGFQEWVGILSNNQ